LALFEGLDQIGAWNIGRLHVREKSVDFVEKNPSDGLMVEEKAALRKGYYISKSLADGYLTKKENADSNVPPFISDQIESHGS
jgi:hypothetical protein